MPLIEEVASGFGPLRSVRHSAMLSKTPAFWARPAMPLGSHPTAMAGARLVHSASVQADLSKL